MQILDIYHKNWNEDLIYLFNKDDIFNPDKRKYCEHSEEIIIQSVFSHYQPQNRWCVDVGAWGIRSSNTYRLIQEGWNSIQIEADSDLYSEMTKNIYQNNSKVTILNKFITPGNIKKCEPDCLDNILSKFKELPVNFDFLSVDVDSFEYEIWKNLNQYSPNLICIECNQFELDFDVIDYDSSFSLYKYQNKQPGYGGATVGLFNKLAEEKGYTYLCLDVSNVFYIKNSFAGL